MSATPDLSLTDLAIAAESASVEAGETTPIIAAEQLVRAAEAHLVRQVAGARSTGVTWQAIGDSLGVTRQAAFKRFGSSLDADLGHVSPSTMVDLHERTHQVFMSLDAGDYDAVRRLMTYACARALSKRKVMTVWRDVTAESGRLREFSDTSARTPDGRDVIEKFVNAHLLTGAVVQTTLHHERGTWVGRVAYNGTGKITGILIAPPDAKDLAF